MLATFPPRMWYFGRMIKCYCYGIKIVLNVHNIYLCYYIKALNYKLDFYLAEMLCTLIDRC